MANMQADVKGAVMPVNGTFYVKYADFIFHSVAQVLLRCGALSRAFCSVVHGKREE